MPCFSQSWSHIIAVAGAASLSCATVAQKEPDLPSLRKVIHHFDFEEHDAAPNSLPAHFYRFVGQSEGYPPFGAMRLSSAEAHTGENSFEFVLDGGSMSARLSSAVIPVLPFTNYSISAKVKTQGLQHARARLVVSLCDSSGSVIPNSRVISQAVQSEDAWTTLQVEVMVRDVAGADLVVEFQVVQPSQLENAAARAIREQPKFQDITGRVWFDDCIVAHLPNVKLQLQNAANILDQRSTPRFEIVVNETGNEALTAHMQILDVDGERVWQEDFPAPRRRQATFVDAPISKCGWYRAILHIAGDRGLSRWQWLDFAIVPATHNARSSNPNSRFGVIVNESESLAHAPELIRVLNAGVVTLPIWSNRIRYVETADQANVHGFIDRVMRQNRGVIFALEEIPVNLARSVDLERRQVMQLLAMKPEIWQPYLNNVLVSYGLEVDRWIIGSPDDAEATMQSGNLVTLYPRVLQSLSQFVPKPHVYLPWSLEHAIPDEPTTRFALSLSPEIHPTNIENYLTGSQEHSEMVVVSIPPAPLQDFSARQSIADLMQRTLFAWRSNASIIQIPAPWQVDAGHLQPSPTPAFAVWRTLVDQLADRQFVSELALPSGMHCWLLRGKESKDAALVAWSDVNGDSTAQTSTLNMQLASGPVRVVDCFGNVTRVESVNDSHSITLPATPIFIEAANLNLVQFRGSIAIDPDFVSATAKVHEHSIVLQNPWPMSISGIVRLASDDAWRLSPAAHDFTIAPGASVKLPLQIVPQRNILAGPKSIAAVVTVYSDQTYTFEQQFTMNVGLRQIDAVPSWTIVKNPSSGENDLVITQAVTNHGDENVRLDIFLLGEGVSHYRRTIPSLGPGETIVRTFRIPNGGTLLSGKQVRIGVAERDGLTRLNQMLTIHAHGERMATVSD